ncbi:hypothetical protein L9F63_016282, partial [Diploptera punctata]
ETCTTYSSTDSSQRKIIKGQTTSTWNERGVFFLTSLGFTTGLQSICLFPVLCDLNGGTVFVLCTMLLYVLLGVPIVLMETGLGQLSRMSPTVLFPKLCPLLSVASSAKYFTTEILGTLSESQVQGHLVLGLAITWTAVAVCLGSGIRHTGKLCYLTTPVIFLVSGIVLVRGLFLWNAAVSQFVAPQWNKMADLSVWFISACYVFHSLNLGMGGLMTISSHNKQTTNIVRDSVLVCLLHFLWGVSMWLAYVCLTAEYRENNAVAGPWILFVVLARGLAALPHGIVFSMIMYIMVFFVGIGTLLGTILTISSTLLHYVPVLRNRRGFVTTGACIVLFLLGIPLASQAGLHLHLLISYNNIKWTLVLYSLCTCFCVMYCYGHRRFITQMCFISNIKLQEITFTHLTVLYCTVIPAFLLLLLMSSFHAGMTLPDGMASHPQQLQRVSWALTSLPVLLLPVCAAFNFIKLLNQKQTVIQSFKSLLRPDDAWLEYMTSRFQCPTRCEKTTMTSPMLVTATKDYSLNSNDGNNNLDEYVVNNALHKSYNEHSMF